MGRRLVHLTRDTLGDLPVACRACAFWELDPVRRDRARAAGDVATEKETWLSHVLLDWGSCGRIAYVDDDPAGYVVYAPARFVPGADSLPTAPVSPDAVLLTTAMVFPEYADAGLGRVLVQAMVKDLIRRGGVVAVEAFGDRSRDGLPPGQAHGGCLLPADFLLRVGFKTQRAHPRFPRMRLELSSVLTWREEVEAAVQRLLGVVRPSGPVPARPGARSVRSAPPVSGGRGA